MKRRIMLTNLFEIVVHTGKLDSMAANKSGFFRMIAR